jgi:hypothetical protein
MQLMLSIEERGNDTALTANSLMTKSKCFIATVSDFVILIALSLLLRDRDLARRSFLRQGLWTEGLRTPPGQECSNGSLTFFAVVLWRTFFAMKLLKVKTGRFSEIVEKAGRPESYTLWQKPSADRHLQSAIKNNRILTIQRSESGTEFGIVGFKQTKDARYLVFPKSLKRFENRRVVGINWDLVSR